MKWASRSQWRQKLTEDREAGKKKTARSDEMLSLRELLAVGWKRRKTQPAEGVCRPSLCWPRCRRDVRVTPGVYRNSLMSITALSHLSLFSCVSSLFPCPSQLSHVSLSSYTSLSSLVSLSAHLSLSLSLLVSLSFSSSWLSLYTRL